MPSEKFKPLLRVGPFKGFDTTSADEYIDPNDASEGSANVDTHRVTGAMLPVRGRANLYTPAPGLTGQFNYIKSFAHKQDQRIIATSGNFSNPQYNVALYYTETQSTLYPGTMLPFTSAEQYGSVLYTNAGQQIRDSNVYSIQQPATALAYNSQITVYPQAPASGHPGLLPGVYYYTITRVTTFSDGTVQESSPDSVLTKFNVYGYFTGDGGVVIDEIFPLFIGSTTASPVYASLQLGTGITWSGSNPDGSTYTTNIYRSSSNQPTWFLLAPTFSGSGFYSDSATDVSISANTQLDFNRDAPPFATNPNGVVFVHQERLWAFLIVNDADTLFAPQCQLWWSDYGLPWSFNKVSSVVLVGNSGVPLAPGGVPFPTAFGNLPVAAVSLASNATLFMTRSMYILFGNDPSNFLVTKAFDIGCVSAQSVVNAQGIVFWLSEQGVYQFDGSSPLYIGEKVRSLIDSVPVADQQNSVAWFADRTYYISFPVKGFTIGFHLPTQQWTTPINFAASAATSQVTESAPSGIVQRHNFVAAGRAGLPFIDEWFAQDGDLGNPVLATWQGGITDSGTPWQRKTYHFVSLNAPVQTGTCQVLLAVFDFANNPQTYALTFDLSLGPNQNQAIPQAARGFSAQLTVTIASVYKKPGPPVSVYSVTVSGRDDDQAYIQRT